MLLSVTQHVLNRPFLSPKSSEKKIGLSPSVSIQVANGCSNNLSSFRTLSAIPAALCTPPASAYCGQSAKEAA